MAQSHCAYCGSHHPLAAEPLWSAELQSRLAADVPREVHPYWLARRRRILPDEPLMRDVCERCSQGVLSRLDSYLCTLYDRTLFQMPARDQSLVFEYDYHLLKSWLLKMCFNSARIHNAFDRCMLEAFVPYVLRGDYELGQSAQLFLQLSHPQQIPRSEMHPVTGVQRPVIYPDVNRIGSLCFTDGAERRILRVVCLRSFTFFLTFWPLGRKLASQNEFADVFTQRRPRTVLLQPPGMRLGGWRVVRRPFGCAGCDCKCGSRRRHWRWRGRYSQRERWCRRGLGSTGSDQRRDQTQA
jgi:hypothetical protein